jgi:lysophospholipase L1-like esterase
MARTLAGFFYLTVALGWCVAAAPSQAAQIVVFGDSWGVPAAPALQQVLIDNGRPETVANGAVGGETAFNLSSPSGLAHISSVLSANPDADLVHLSISGNDFLGNWNSSLTPAQEAALFDSILTDVETIVDHIVLTRPNAQIFWSSYDYPRPLPLGTPAEVNAASDSLGALAQALADAEGPALTWGNFNGLMQVSFGFDGVQYTPFDPATPIPAGDPSLPDPSLPSPFDSYSDPIHLTSQGYSILAEEQYAFFYAGIPEPSTAILLALGLVWIAAGRRRTATARR